MNGVWGMGNQGAGGPLPLGQITREWCGMTNKGPAMPSTPKKSGFSRESGKNDLGEHIAKELDYKPNGNMETAIEGAGGDIYYREPWDFERGINSSVVIEKVRKFTIYISTYTTADRDRFTVAHGLGHYILHYFTPSKNDTTPLGTMTHPIAGKGRIEWEANWFASGFLMPRSVFYEIYEEESGDLEFVAERFGVSYNAALARAKT